MSLKQYMRVRHRCSFAAWKRLAFDALVPDLQQRLSDARDQFVFEASVLRLEDRFEAVLETDPVVR